MIFVFVFRVSYEVQLPLDDQYDGNQLDHLDIHRTYYPRIVGVQIVEQSMCMYQGT